jgi:DNA-binding transcriptional ArsR family regulator
VIMDKFYALSTPIRREIIALLSEGQMSATAIAEKFQVSPSAISQHLKVLRMSKLVDMHRDAQQRIYELNPDALVELENWAKQLIEHMDNLGGLMDKKEPDTSQEAN